MRKAKPKKRILLPDPKHTKKKMKKKNLNRIMYL